MVSVEKTLFDELDSPSSYCEFKTILAKVNVENPYSDILFKGKYQVLLLENLLPWQKPIGQFFQTTLAICGAKPKKFNIPSANCDPFEETYASDDEDYGNPLPVVFDSLIVPDSGSASSATVKHLKEKYHLYPLSQNIAKKLLMLCTVISDEYCIPYPVTVLSHCRNPKAMCLQGVLKNDKSVHVLVTHQGSVSKQEHIPRMSIVKLAHLAGFVPSCTSVETSVYARYDVLGSEDGSYLQGKDMNVVVECFWSNPCAILEPVTTDCTCYVKIKVMAGDEESGACEKFKELKLVMALYESLETGVMNWPESDSCGLMQKVADFMRAEISAVIQKQKNIPASMDFESFDSFVKGNRTDLDFTDKLWLVLKDCSSCDELVEALTYVYRELSGLVNPPFVYPKNMSTIACAVKNIRKDTLILPEICSGLALRMLLEIGIEKLRKDYTILFVGMELAPYDSIYWFLRPDLVSAESVICLRKLHTVLELAIIGLKFLLLPKQLLSEFVRNALKHYTTVSDIDLQYVFKFQIPSAKARHLLDQMRPTVWEISLLSSDKDYKKQTVHHYFTPPVYENVYAPKGYQPKLMLKNVSYVYMTGTYVEDSFFVK